MDRDSYFVQLDDDQLRYEAECMGNDPAYLKWLTDLYKERDMAFTAPVTSDSDFERAPQGTFAGRCYRVIDLGTQLNKAFNKMQRKVLIQWELPEEKMEDGRPFSVSQRYTLNMGDKANLRKDLESWRGEAFTDEQAAKFDLSKLINQWCLLTLTHNKNGDKTYVNVSSVAKPMRGFIPPEPGPNEAFCFNLANFDQAIFDKLSDGIKKVIQSSPEWHELHNPKREGEDPGPESDIPF